MIIWTDVFKNTDACEIFLEKNNTAWPFGRFW